MLRCLQLIFRRRLFCLWLITYWPQIAWPFPHPFSVDQVLNLVIEYSIDSLHSLYNSIWVHCIHVLRRNQANKHLLLWPSISTREHLGCTLWWWTYSSIRWSQLGALPRLNLPWSRWRLRFALGLGSWRWVGQVERGPARPYRLKLQGRTCSQCLARLGDGYGIRLRRNFFSLSICIEVIHQRGHRWCSHKYLRPYVFCSHYGSKCIYSSTNNTQSLCTVYSCSQLRPERDFQSDRQV